MNKYNVINDYYFTEDGDFLLDASTEDLRDTKNDNYRGFIQKIYTVVSSQKRDWRLSPNLGANISDFLGQPNTRELGQALKNRLFFALTANNFINPVDLEIFVFPRSKESIVAIISVTPPDAQTKVRLSFVYNTKDNTLTPRNL